LGIVLIAMIIVRVLVQMVWDAHIHASSYILISLLSMALDMALVTVSLGLAARYWHLACLLGML
jgi:hypothetical protein